jgi:hypothetical protein
MWPKTFTIVERVETLCLRNETRKALRDGSTCMPERVSLDPATSSPQPDLATADATFEGDVYGLRVHVWHGEDGTYDYMESWTVGPPPFWELVNVGWDWKTGCRIHSCGLSDGRRCCWQECRDGGDRRFAYEGPDRFTCMNLEMGAIFQWFLEGLAESGVEGIDGCR